MKKKKRNIIYSIKKELKRRKKIKELEELYAFGVDCWEDDEYLKGIEDEIKHLKRKK